MINLNIGTNYISLSMYILEEQFNILQEDTATFGVVRNNCLLHPLEINVK